MRIGQQPTLWLVRSLRFFKRSPAWRRPWRKCEATSLELMNAPSSSTDAPSQGRRPSKTAAFFNAAANWVVTGPERAYLGTQAALQHRPTWNSGFKTSVGLLKAGAYSLPRNVEAIRVVTDHAIPGVILPKDVRIDAMTLVPEGQLPALRAERYTRRAYRAHPVHNSERSSCSACNTSFGLITRKSHCRLCGEIFCRDCAPKRIHAGCVRLALRLAYCVFAC